MTYRSLIEAIEDIIYSSFVLDEIFICTTRDGQTYIIEDGKWIHTQTSRKIRIDQPTHGAGQTHAHIYARKGAEIGVVNIDGTPSHGSKMRISSKDADTLRSHGFNIPKNRIVEWTVRPEWTRNLLLG